MKTILAEGHLTFRQRLALKRFVPALSDLYNSPEFGAKLAAGATCAVVNEEWMDKQIGGGAFGLGPQKRSAQEWQDLIYEDVIRDMGFNTSKGDRDFWEASGGQIVRKFVTVAQMSRYSPGTALAYYRAC